jgi:hypothetical protein
MYGREHVDDLLDDLPEEYVALAADLRALIDAGLIRATTEDDATLRFAVCEAEERAA